MHSLKAVTYFNMKDYVLYKRNFLILLDKKRFLGPCCPLLAPAEHGSYSDQDSRAEIMNY